MKIPRFIQYFPVMILRGPARFSWWTLYPHSSYWRRGGHEPEIAGAIAMLGELTGKVAWDLGAHFGIHTVGFARQVGCSGQVVAFEPDPVSFGRLAHHVRMNRLPQVLSLNAAAGDETREQTLVTNLGVGATTSHLPYPGEVVAPNTQTLVIRCVRADELVEAGQIRPPDIIKLDVEGHGGEALAGARAAILLRRPVIIASTHSPQEAASIRAVLAPAGYAVHSLGSAQAGLKQTSWEDFQSGRNYVLRCPKAVQ